LVVDFLSRLNINDVDTPIEDIFPHWYIFSISTHTPWYAYIANYLATGKVPHHLSYREQRRIIQQSVRYTWIEGYLLYTGPNQQIQHYVRKDEIHDILKVTHDGPCGGHFAHKRSGHKVL